MQVRVSRWGNSLAVRLPKELAQQLSLTEGQSVNISVEDQTIKVQPIVTQRFPTLAEMVGEAKRLGPDSEPEFVEWGPDKGAEIIADAYSRRPKPARRKPAK